MSERSAFHEAIRRAPEEDAPRLIFADWLDENGDPLRAAFIRFQVAAWGGPPGDLGADGERLAWRLGLPVKASPGFRPAEALMGFSRGFLRGFHHPHRQEAAEPLRELLDAEPMRVCSARVWGVTENAGWPGQRLVEMAREVELYGSLRTGPARLGCLPVCRSFAWFGDSIAQNPAPVEVDLPDADGFGIEWEWLRSRIPPSRPAGPVRRLAIRNASGPHLAGGLNLFAADPVEELGLTFFDPAGDFMTQLARWPPAANLRRLALRFDLRPDEPSPIDWPALSLATPNLRALKARDFAGNPDVPADAWPLLESLDLERFRADATGPMTPGLGWVLGRLTDLRLGSRADEAPALARDLASRRDLPLRRLCLPSCGGASAQRLAVLPALARLEALRLGMQGERQAARPAIDALARSAFAANLRALELPGLGGEAAVRQARKSFGPRCDVFWQEG